MPEPIDDGPDQGDTDGPNDQQQQQQHDEAPTWKPPASQDELNKLIDRAVGRAHAKYKDYDQLKEKADEYDSLAAASQTDQERAVAEAQELAFNAALGSVVPRLVRAEFRAAAKGRLSKEQLDGLLEDLDLTKYVDDDGEPDVDRIEKRVDLLAPKASPPHFGQGNRGTPPSTKSMDDLIRTQAGYSRT